MKRSKVIRLAHNKSHPGQNALKRRLRNHFYIKDLDIKVTKDIRDCSYCQMFTQKTLRHHIKRNLVLEKCWQETSLDLFGPLLSSYHVLVVQDLASCYPVAKIVRSTNAKPVIPVLRDAYDLFSNPLSQKSDNGPPFNSSEMAKFSKNRNIEQVKTPPGYPAANNVKTVMKPLDKAMKKDNMQNLAELETLSAFLRSYRDTAHISTGVPPAHVLFREGYRNNLFHHKTPDDKMREARQTDRDIKKERKSTYNSSRHIVDMNLKLVIRFSFEIIKRNQSLILTIY